MQESPPGLGAAFRCGCEGEPGRLKERLKRGFEWRAFDVAQRCRGDQVIDDRLARGVDLDARPCRCRILQDGRFDGDFRRLEYFLPGAVELVLSERSRSTQGTRWVTL